jgi:hypothetical protein
MLLRDNPRKVWVAPHMTLLIHSASELHRQQDLQVKPSKKASSKTKHNRKTKKREAKI